MHTKIMSFLWLALLIGTASAETRETRTIEIPIGKAGDIQVAEIVSRLAKASGVSLPLPAANVTLSTQGFAGRSPEPCSRKLSVPRSRSRFAPG